MTPAFRMHVKAHGTVAKIFRALDDATKDQVYYIIIVHFYFVYIYIKFWTFNVNCIKFNAV